MLANKLNYINNKFLKVVKKKTGELKVTPYMQDFSKLQNICA